MSSTVLAARRTGRTSDRRHAGVTLRFGDGNAFTSKSRRRRLTSDARSASRERFWLDCAARRGLDVLVAVVALLLLLPLLVFVALAVFADDPGPVLFRQRRVGRRGETFTCLKFRSMRTDAEGALDALLRTDPAARAEWEESRKLKRDPRITRLGAFLRKSSLDELPQLWNVLRGEMSLVGPRPIVEAEVARYGRHFRHYCDLRPGVTGLWQVSGRSDVDYRRRVVLDVAYARHHTAGLNLKLLFATVPAVLLRRGSC